MTYYGRIYDNGRDVFDYVVVPRRPRVAGGPDVVVHYEWTVIADPDLAEAGMSTRLAKGAIDHRFGDGSLDLVAQVLQLAKAEFARQPKKRKKT